MIYWFYCDENDPIDFPDMNVMYSVTSEKPYKNYQNMEEAIKDLDNLLEYCRKIRQEFIEVCEKNNIPIDHITIQAKYIPQVDELAKKIGWKKEYIPFGP